MRRYFIVFFLLLTIRGKTQTNDFDLIETVKTDSGSKIVYLTAVWCKPCMDKLDTIIRSFGGDKTPQLIVLFDRYGYQQVYDKLTKLYDTSFFRIMPGRYYDLQSKGILNIKFNPGKKIMKRFNAEVGDYLSKNLTLDDLWFGQAIYLRDKKLVILKEMDKDNLVRELKSMSN